LVQLDDVAHGLLTEVDSWVCAGHLHNPEQDDEEKAEQALQGHLGQVQDQKVPRGGLHPRPHAIRGVITAADQW